MTLATYFTNGGTIFDTENYGYPECLATAEIRNNIVESLDLDYSARNISRRIERRAINDSVTLNSRILAHVHALSMRNEYKWNKLFATLDLEYNPIENYSMIELETTNFDKGAQNNSETLGQVEKTTNFGQAETTNNYGAENSTLGYGATKETTERGATQKTNVFGATETTVDYGATQKTNVFGEKTETHNIGETKETATIGARATTSSESISAFNSTGYNPDRQTLNATESATDISKSDAHVNTDTFASVTDTENENARQDRTTGASRTDTESEIARTDTVSAQAKTDTIVKQAKIDTFTESAKTDKETVAEIQNTFIDGARTDEMSRTRSRSGNVGVTTSQQMIISEREVALFSFVKTVCDDIVGEICINIF